jgi:hypothetical protein
MFRLTRRSWPGRVVRWPGVCWQHYRILRQHTGRWVALREAVRLTRSLLAR